jgi:hypothetical protein
MFRKLRQILGSGKSSRRSPGREPFQFQFERRFVLGPFSISLAATGSRAACQRVGHFARRLAIIDVFARVYAFVEP